MNLSFKSGNFGPQQSPTPFATDIINNIPPTTTLPIKADLQDFPNIITQYWMKDETIFPSLFMVKGNFFLINSSQLSPSVILFYRQMAIVPS